MPTSVRLSPGIEQRLSEMAKKTQRSKAGLIRHLIEQGLEDMEDYYAAEEVMKGIRSGKVKLHDLEDVMREIELMDD